MASREIAVITRSDLQHLVPPPGDAYITNVKSASSYNWIDAPDPTIVVPGCPPVWNPPKVALPLKKDSGLYYVAQNAACFPASPMEPLFRALYVSHPSFDIRSIDVISDRHNIRKLLSFINPSLDRNARQTFNMKLEVVRNTLLLCRHETTATMYIHPNEFWGYGHEFESVYTTSQIGGSTGHHRIISYRFCGMEIMIRHETDGFVSPRSDRVANAKRDSFDANNGSCDPSGSLSPSCTRKTSLAGNSKPTRLTVLRKGETISIESTLEIKTCGARRALALQDVAAQLWASQTPKLVRAYHNNGQFLDPTVEDVEAEIRDWERGNRADLRILGALIHKILEMMKACGGRGRLRYEEATDRLVIWEVDEPGMLPEDLYSKWDA